jgi:hypothetical protein
VKRFVDKENRFIDRVVLVGCDSNVVDGGVGNVDEVWVESFIALMVQVALLSFGCI